MTTVGMTTDGTITVGTTTAGMTTAETITGGTITDALTAVTTIDAVMIRAVAMIDTMIDVWAATIGVEITMIDDRALSRMASCVGAK